MVYQYHLTKFCVLRPFASNRAAEVAYQVMDVFLLFGAPTVLQSDNGSDFTGNIITKLKQLWPDMKLVQGNPRHPHGRWSVERANDDINDMLVVRLANNNAKDWTPGIKFVQFHKNSAHHLGVHRIQPCLEVKFITSSWINVHQRLKPICLRCLKTTLKPTVLTAAQTR